MATFENTVKEDNLLRIRENDDKDLTMETPSDQVTETIRIESPPKNTPEADHADTATELIGTETPCSKTSAYIASETSSNGMTDELKFEAPSERAPDDIIIEPSSVLNMLNESIMDIQIEPLFDDTVTNNVRTPSDKLVEGIENKAPFVTEICTELPEDLRSGSYDSGMPVISDTANESLEPFLDQETEVKTKLQSNNVKKLVQLYEQAAEGTDASLDKLSEQSKVYKYVNNGRATTIDDDTKSNNNMHDCKDAKNHENFEVHKQTHFEDSIKANGQIFDATKCAMRNVRTTNDIIAGQNESICDNITTKMDSDNRKPLFDDSNEDDESLFSPIPKKKVSCDEMDRVLEAVEKQNVMREPVSDVETEECGLSVGNVDETKEISGLSADEHDEATEVSGLSADETVDAHELLVNAEVTSKPLVYETTESSDMDSDYKSFETSEDNKSLAEETFDGRTQNIPSNEENKSIFVESIEASEPLFDEETLNRINRRASIFDKSTEVNESKFEKSNEWIKPLFDGAKQGNEALLYGAIDEVESHLQDETDGVKMYPDGADLEAMNEFYQQLEIWGWNKDIDDIDFNAPSEHGAFFRIDHGKVYVSYGGFDVLISKERGSGFSKPSTIAEHAEEKGLNGNHFVRNVLGILTFGVGRRSSISRAVEARSINVFLSEYPKVMEKLGTQNCVELQDMNKSDEDEMAEDDAENKVNFVRPQDSGLAFYRQLFVPWKRRSLIKTNVIKNISEENEGIDRNSGSDDGVFVDQN